MYSLYGIAVKVKQVCTSLAVVGENKSQQNMKAETAYTEIGKTQLNSAGLPTNICTSQRIAFLIENTFTEYISKNKSGSI